MQYITIIFLIFNFLKYFRFYIQKCIFRSKMYF